MYAWLFRLSCRMALVRRVNQAFWCRSALSGDMALIFSTLPLEFAPVRVPLLEARYERLVTAEPAYLHM